MLKQWHEYKAPIALSGDRVDIWCIWFEDGSESILDYLDILSSEERKRAKRFHRKVDFHRFVVARYVLRTLLGGIVGAQPSSLEFSTNKYGKPKLLPKLSLNQNSESINFNLSHAGEYGLVAISTAKKIGIDIERIREIDNIEELAKRSFSNDEYLQFITQPEFDRLNTFFRCWTRKEAFIKAIGKGLNQPLDSFSVSSSPDQEVKFLSLPPGYQLKNWALYDIGINQHYRAALAIDRAITTVACWQWQQ